MDAFCPYDAEKKNDKLFNKLFTEFSNISGLYGRMATKISFFAQLKPLKLWA